jgi:hypothetical protein
MAERGWEETIITDDFFCLIFVLERQQQQRPYDNNNIWNQAQ